MRPGRSEESPAWPEKLHPGQNSLTRELRSFFTDNDYKWPSPSFIFFLSICLSMDRRATAGSWLSTPLICAPPGKLSHGLHAARDALTRAPWLAVPGAPGPCCGRPPRQPRDPRLAAPGSMACAPGIQGSRRGFLGPRLQGPTPGCLAMPGAAGTEGPKRQSSCSCSPGPGSKANQRGPGSQKRPSGWARTRPGLLE